MAAVHGRLFTPAPRPPPLRLVEERALARLRPGASTPQCQRSSEQARPGAAAGRHLCSARDCATRAAAQPEAGPSGGDIEDTIVALSSGAGRSAVAVVRISGPQADAVLQAMLQPGSSLPQPRTAALRSLFDPESRQPLDKALVLRFPGPGSFTGEDVVELQGHGGPAVVRALLTAITGWRGVRLAEAGEFTKRAFMGGKLDLTEVEGIADLLAAETDAQHQQALRQSSGVQRRQYESWRRALLTCLAHVEAVIDFGDDNDISSGVAAEVAPGALALRRELERHLAEARRGELVRDGVKVALIGPPNAGKSTLLNRLAGREAAIVSPIPGTTRDALEVALELGGQKVIVTDTAGVRETADLIEAEGVSRARAAAVAADIVVAVADCGAPQHDAELLQLAASLAPPQPDGNGASEAAAGGPQQQQRRLSAGWSVDSLDFEHSLAEAAAGGSGLENAGRPVLLVFNKCDLAGLQPFKAGEAGGSEQAWLRQRLGERSLPAVADTLAISASQGEGLELLLCVLEARVAAAAGREGGEGALITRLRHRRHVAECVEALRSYEAHAGQLELAAEELRWAARALGRVTGAIDTEQVLDAVFSEFCIGK